MFPTSPVTAATSGFPKNTNTYSLNAQSSERNDHFSNITEVQNTDQSNAPNGNKRLLNMTKSVRMVNTENSSSKAIKYGEFLKMDPAT